MVDLIFLMHIFFQKLLRKKIFNSLTAVIDLLKMVVTKEANIKFKHARGSIQLHHIAPLPEDIPTRVIIKIKCEELEFYSSQKTKEDRPLRKIV